MKKTIFDQKPDVEVLFEFNGSRKNPAADGYRPHHLVTGNYLTTGVHHYYDVQTIPPNGTAKGTITFIFSKLCIKIIVISQTKTAILIQRNCGF